MRRTIARFLIVFLGMSGCDNIPDSDQKWLDRHAEVGMNAQSFVELVESRGFSEPKLGNYSPNADGWYPKIDAPYGLIGLTRVDANPRGEVWCLRKPYERLTASGDRLICYSQTDDGHLQWRQAGFFGASL